MFVSVTNLEFMSKLNYFDDEFEEALLVIRGDWCVGSGDQFTIYGGTQIHVVTCGVREGGKVGEGRGERERERGREGGREGGKEGRREREGGKEGSREREGGWKGGKEGEGEKQCNGGMKKEGGRNVIRRRECKVFSLFRICTLHMYIYMCKTILTNRQPQHMLRRWEFKGEPSSIVTDDLRGRKEGGREEGEREGGKERGREGGREGEKEGGREGGKEGGREGGKDGGKEGGKERGKEGG